jgi:hypothetical protein
MTSPIMYRSRQKRRWGTRMTLDIILELKFVFQAPTPFGRVLRSCAAPAVVLLEGGVVRNA